MKQGQFPTMTIYEITDSGRELFDKMQEEAFLGLFPQFYSFKLALKINVRRTPEEIARIAEKAIGVIDSIMDQMDRYMESQSDPKPRLETDGFFIEHDRMLLRQENMSSNLQQTRLLTYWRQNQREGNS